MKDFFRSVLATIVGILICTFVLGLISAFLFFGMVTVISSSSSSSYNLKNNTILTLNLTGQMKDRVVENPLMQYLGLREANEIALTDILSAIKKAKENDKIRGIYIKAGYLSASSASLNEIREKLEDFKTTGKFIVVYGDDYLQGNYFLTSVADKLILNPQGSVDLHGLSVGRTFYKDLLDKLGVEIQIFKVG
ncbi:MAG TPA: signal peptide peptidase SppA, partial [Dysgonomonas sp.]|nr:signal peptide peptidase SppA [Dysgonomonas sp.]